MAAASSRLCVGRRGFPVSLEEWSGIRLNLKKTIGSRVGVDASGRSTAQTLMYQGKPIRMATESEPIRYLGFWATANGDYREAKSRVLNRTREAVELIRHHPCLARLNIVGGV